MKTNRTESRIRLRHPPRQRPVPANMPVVAPPTLPPPSRVWRQTDPSELGSPDAWLYVSLRLDLTLLPNTPLWQAPAILLGSRAFYRLTPAVLVWLWNASEHLQQQFEAGKVARDQLTEFIEAMATVEAFAAVWLSREAVSEARAEARKAGEVVGLPEVYAPQTAQ
jgi:hypothetical protein